MYGEKVVARYDPHRNPEWGGEGGGVISPNGILKSWP